MEGTARARSWRGRKRIAPSRNSRVSGLAGGRGAGEVSRGQVSESREEGPRLPGSGRDDLLRALTPNPWDGPVVGSKTSRGPRCPWRVFTGLLMTQAAAFLWLASRRALDAGLFSRSPESASDPASCRSLPSHHRCTLTPHPFLLRLHRTARPWHLEEILRLQSHLPISQREKLRPQGTRKRPFPQCLTPRLEESQGLVPGLLTPDPKSSHCLFEKEEKEGEEEEGGEAVE